jgi:hypothetical protein
MREQIYSKMTCPCDSICRRVLSVAGQLLLIRGYCAQDGIKLSTGV